MSDPTYVLLYVANPEASAAFYSRILGKEPVERSPSFVLYVLGSGVKLGLWSASDVSPAALVGAGAVELAVSLPDAGAVDALFEAWRSEGVAMAQAPVALDFGYAFLALDPDGHRVRVFAPASRE